MLDITLLEESKKFYPRSLEKEIKDELLGKKAIFLMGSRRTGKTSLMLRLINFLAEDKKIPISQLFYFDLESLPETEAVLKLSYPHTKKQLSLLGAKENQDIFVFIDEIQYLDNPSSFVKLIYDHVPGVHLILSGSSTLAIKKKFKDSLSGRKRLFQIKTLNFSEFLLFKDEQNLWEKKQSLTLTNIIANKISIKEAGETQMALGEKFASYFTEFILYGGYPETISFLESQKEKELVDIYTSYIRKDIKDIARIASPDNFNRLTKILAVNAANLLNINDLLNDLNLSRPTIENYLFLLENTFIIKRILPFFRNKRKELISWPKIYFEDTGMRNLIMGNFLSLDRRSDSGALWENVIFGEIDKQKEFLDEIHYWRTQAQAEVDFIFQRKDGTVIPIEVKFQSFTKPKIESALRNFIETYRPEEAFVFNKNLVAKEEYKNTRVFFLPAWMV